MNLTYLQLPTWTLSQMALPGVQFRANYFHWTHVKIFWDTKVTEYVETMPYFVINFWAKKLIKIFLFKDISWNQKFEKTFFFPMIFWDRKLAETIQLSFHCCDDTSEENTAFKMIFWSRKTSQKQKFGNIFWCNKWNEQLNVLHIF